MDLSGVLTIPNILLVTVAILTGLYFYGRRNFGFFTESGLKCPEPTAFLGNMIEMSRKGLDQVLFDWQKECGDTYGVFFGNHPSFVSANPEIIEEITVKDFAKFRNRYNAPTLNEYAANMISHATDDHWKYLRTVLAPAYTSKRMREMVPLA